MDLSARVSWDQRIGALLLPVVNKLVSPFQALDQFLTDRRPQNRMHLLLGGLQDGRKRRGRANVSETSELLQRVLRFGRQAGHLAQHEVYDIVGITFVVNATEIPGPARRVLIEAEQSLFRERVKKLNHEEGIAGGPLMH